LGADSLAEQARAQANEPVTIKSNEEALLPREPFVIPSGTLPPSGAVEQAIRRRAAAAKQLDEDLQAVQPRRIQDWPQDSLAELKEALIAEDSARSSYYEQQLAGSPAPDVRVALLRDRVNWLALKYRAANEGFGAPLVEQWHKDSAAIRDAWSSAWSDLFRMYESQAGAIPNAQAVSQATEDVLREELLAIRWGWYRGASEQDIHGLLEDMSRRMREASILSLRVDLLRAGDRTTDFLVPDELYGQNQRALPK
jgi:hypothetical protein